MEPSAAEKLAIIDLDSLAAWAGLSDLPIPVGAPPVAGDAPLTTLLGSLGMAHALHFRLLASVDPTAFATVLVGWRINALPPTPLHLAAATLMHSTARRLCALEPWPGMVPPAAAIVPLVPLPAVATGKFKLATVLDQTSESEVAYILDADLQACHARYQTVMGEPPTPELAPTEEQLSAVDATLKLGRNPYADFCVFGPFGTRLLRKIRLSGLRMDTSGELRTAELFGPGSFALWDACFGV